MVMMFLPPFFGGLGEEGDKSPLPIAPAEPSALPTAPSAWKRVPRRSPALIPFPQEKLLGS